MQNDVRGTEALCVDCQMNGTGGCGGPYDCECPAMEERKVIPLIGLVAHPVSIPDRGNGTRTAD